MGEWKPRVNDPVRSVGDLPGRVRARVPRSESWVSGDGAQDDTLIEVQWPIHVGQVSADQLRLDLAAGQKWESPSGVVQTIGGGSPSYLHEPGWDLVEDVQRSELPPWKKPPEPKAWQPRVGDPVVITAPGTHFGASAVVRLFSPSNPHLPLLVQTRDGGQRNEHRRNLCLRVEVGQWWERTATGVQYVVEAVTSDGGLHLRRLDTNQTFEPTVRSPEGMVALLSGPEWKHVPHDNSYKERERVTKTEGQPEPHPGQFWRKGSNVVELLSAAGCGGESWRGRWWVYPYAPNAIGRQEHVDLRYGWTLLSEEDRPSVILNTRERLDELNEYAYGRGSASLPAAGEPAIEAALAEARLRLHGLYSESELQAHSTRAAAELRAGSAQTVQTLCERLYRSCHLNCQFDAKVWAYTVVGRFLRESLPELAAAAELAVQLTESALAAKKQVKAGQLWVFDVPGAQTVDTYVVKVLANPNYAVTGHASIPHCWYTRVLACTRADEIGATRVWDKGQEGHGLRRSLVDPAHLLSAVASTVQSELNLSPEQVVAAEQLVASRPAPTSEPELRDRLQPLLGAKADLLADRLWQALRLAATHAQEERKMEVQEYVSLFEGSERWSQPGWLRDNIRAFAGKIVGAVHGVSAEDGRALVLAVTSALQIRIWERTHEDAGPLHAVDDLICAALPYPVDKLPLPDGIEAFEAKMVRLYRAWEDEQIVARTRNYIESQRRCAIKADWPALMLEAGNSSRAHQLVEAFKLERWQETEQEVRMAAEQQQGQTMMVSAPSEQEMAFYARAMRETAGCYLASSVSHNLALFASRLVAMTWPSAVGELTLAPRVLRSAINDALRIRVAAAAAEQPDARLAPEALVRAALPFVVPEYVLPPLPVWEEFERRQLLLHRELVGESAVSTVETRKDTTMSRVKEQAAETWDALKDEGAEAAWNTVAIKAIDWGKGLIVGLAVKHIDPKDKTLKGKLTKALNTEGGAMVISFAMSGAVALFGSQVAPVLGIEPRNLSYLGERLRVMGMTKGGVAVVDGLLDQLKQKAGPLVTLLKAMPAMTPTNGALPSNGALRLSPEEAPVRERAR